MRACRIDGNHTEIVAEFRRLKWYVLDIHTLKNCCDILVSKDFITYAIEIKDGNKPPSQRKLTSGELSFSKEWKGNFALILSVNDVQRLDTYEFKKI